MADILIGLLLTVHVIVCVLLVLLVLMQRPRSEGLGTAFGSGVTDTLFGSSTGNVLTKITTWLGIIFFITTISLAYLYSYRTPASKLGTKLQNAPTTKEPSAPETKTPSPQPAPVPDKKPAPPTSPATGKNGK